MPPDPWLAMLEKGKVADLIVLDANPLDDLRINAGRKCLVFVVKEGKIIACHADFDLPAQLLANKRLSIE